jgi:hypothetical protein
MEISVDDLRDLTRWLCRKSFHKFKLIDNELSGIYFMSSFNLSRIEIDGKLIGLELTAITNAPYGFAEDVTVKFDADAGEVISVYNRSDNEGHIYPNVKITIKEINEDGNLVVTNHTEDRKTEINNCKSNEVITIDYPMISSSLEDKRETKITNDFNWVFPRLTSTFKNRLNEIETSLPCSIELTYTPIIKIGI